MNTAAPVMTPPPAWTARVEARTVDPMAVLKVGELVVNGQVVFRLRTDQGGLWPDQRVQIAAERLRAAIAAGLTPGDILVDTSTDKANPRLKALGQVIATASAEEAKGSGASPGGLAQTWAAALRKALAIPGIATDASGIVVPLNETRVIKVSGAARGPVSFLTATGESKIAGVSVDPVSGDVTLTGATPGKDVLTLSREGAVTTVYVAVQPYAGRFDTPRPVIVTGNGVPAELIARHAASAALAAARPNPGASAQITTGTLSAAPLSEGQGQTVAVPVQMSGADMIPVTRTLRVSVTGQTLPPVATGNLFYSNNPERVTGFGTLFVGRMPQALAATRLLYHHQSAMPRAAWFTVELVNDKDAAAQVQVVGGDAGPVRDTVWVGFRAASNFVRDFGNDLGAVVEVPARSRVALSALRLAPGLTISGLMQLRLLGGPAPLVRVAADIPGHELSMPGTLQPVPAAWTDADAGQAFVLSEHVYPEPTRRVQARYAVGDRWAFIALGRVPIKAAETARKLEGNYGVFYDIEVALENPTDRPARIRILFEPAAGLAGGVFLIDGKTVEIPQTAPPAEPVLATYTLEPGAKQTVQIKTLPLSGSNYPATIVVRP